MNTSAAAINRKIDAINRKANPAARDAGVFTNLDAPKNARTRYFRHASDEWALSHGFPYRLISQHEGEGAPVKFGKTRAYVAIDEGPDGSPVVETWRISGLQMWSGNPTHKRNPAGRVAKSVSEMSAAAINREMDALSRKMSALNDEMIEAGRGHERPSDTEGKTDPLSVRFNAARSRWADLRYEVKRRAGPDVDRLPRGFGPMKNPTPKRAPRTVALLARKSNPAGGVLFAIKVNAGNDRSGNPRRGWVVEEIIDGADIRHIGFVDEEYGGARSLREAYGDLPTTGEFDISPKDYAHFKKMGPVWIETGRYLGRR